MTDERCRAVLEIINGAQFGGSIADNEVYDFIDALIDADLLKEDAS